MRNILINLSVNIDLRNINKMDWKEVLSCLLQISISEKCPVCGEGKLTNKLSYTKVKYKNKSCIIPTFYSICTYCGVEIAEASQMNVNKQQIIKFRNKVKNTLL